MQLIAPSGSKKKWTIRFRNHDGLPVKIYAWETKDKTLRFWSKVNDLLKAKVEGEPPPVYLRDWIDNLTESHAKRLTALGLLDERRKLRGRPLSEHIDAYEKAVAARRSNTASHAKRMAGYVRRVCKELNVETYGDLSASDVEVKLKEKSITDTTRKQYLIAFRNFCQWMVREKRGTQNPMEHVRLPRSDADPTFKRRPLYVDEFKRLIAYLDGMAAKGGKYPKQRTGWTAADRKIIYQVAVATALRQDEMRSLRRHHLKLDENPVVFEVPASVTKNSKSATVPIGPGLAESLRAYVEGMEPGDRLLPIPANRNAVVKMFRRDLEGAKVKHTDKDTDERVDFHTLRATAITWWFTEHDLSVREVAELARATPKIVERYARHFKIRNFGWLAKEPSMGAAETDAPKDVVAKVG